MLISLASRLPRLNFLAILATVAYTLINSHRGEGLYWLLKCNLQLLHKVAAGLLHDCGWQGRQMMILWELSAPFKVDA